MMKLTFDEDDKEEEIVQKELVPQTPAQGILPQSNQLWAPRFECKTKSRLADIDQKEFVEQEEEESLCFGTNLLLVLEEEDDGEREGGQSEEEQEDGIMMKLKFDGYDQEEE